MTFFSCAPETIYAQKIARKPAKSPNLLVGNAVAPIAFPDSGLLALTSTKRNVFSR